MNKNDFENIETLENWVTYDYLRSTLGWSNNEVAYVMNVNERRLIEWINARKAEMNKVATSSFDKVKRIRQRLEKDYPKPKPENKKRPQLDIKKAVKMLKEKKTLSEMAKSFRIKPNDFRIWWNENIQVINERVKRNV